MIFNLIHIFKFFSDVALSLKFLY